MDRINPCCNEEVEPPPNIPRIYCSDWAVFLAHLKPRVASRRPHKPFHQFVCVIMKFLHTFRFGLECFDVLRLQFVDHLEPASHVRGFFEYWEPSLHVAGMPIENWEEGSMRCGSIGSNEYCPAVSLCFSSSMS